LDTLAVRPRVAVGAPGDASGPRNSPAAGSETLFQFLLPSEGTDAHNKVALDANVAAALRERALTQELDRLRDAVADTQRADNEVVASSVVMSAGLSVGYVLWLARGGVLLASLMSALPAWAMVDPMPVLAQMQRRDSKAEDDTAGDDDEDHDPIERLFSKARQIMKRQDEPAAPALAEHAVRRDTLPEQRT
jgi:hypothetical protein